MSRKPRICENRAAANNPIAIVRLTKQMWLYLQSD